VGEVQQGHLIVGANSIHPAARCTASYEFNLQVGFKIVESSAIVVKQDSAKLVVSCDRTWRQK
jgi:hypothetical protein